MSRRTSIFPNDSPTSSGFLFGPTKENELNHSNEYASLHQLSGSDISRLVALKYNGDPMLLVRQLSLELCTKEEELAALNRDRFHREQILIRLCNEYGNLSTMEIDRKIQEGMKEKDKNPETVHKNSSDNHNVHKNSSDNPNVHKNSSDNPNVHKENSSDNHNVHKENSNPEPKKGYTLEEKPSKPIINRQNTNPSRSSSSSSSLAGPRARSISDDSFVAASKARSDSAKDVYSKLRSWFNSSDDLTADAPKIPASISKAPVELDSFTGEEPASEQEIEFEVPVDKYGFITDVKALKKKQQQQSDKEPGFFIDDTINDKNDDVEDPAILIGNKSRFQTIHKLKQISEQHDNINMKFEKEWDILFNNIKRDFARTHQNIAHSEEIVGVRALNLLTLDQRQKTNYHAKFVKLVNNMGIPPKYRVSLWLELSGGQNLRVHGEYRQLLSEVEACVDNMKDPDNRAGDDRFRKIIENIQQIDLDLHRTLPSNYHFNNMLSFKPGPSFYKLQRILYAFVAYRTDIGYIQGMNKIVGNLLLLSSKNDGEEHKFKEEDVFWIFVGLTEEILPRYVNDNNERMYFNALMDIRNDQTILHEHYLKKHLPQLYKHFSQVGLEVEVVTLNWWLTLFIDLQFMDLDTWFKLFENLFVDTVSNELDLVDDPVDHPCRSALKLLSLSLSIFKALESILLSMTQVDDIYQLLSSNKGRNSEGQRVVKYTELLSYHRSFMKAISATDFEKQRRS